MGKGKIEKLSIEWLREKEKSKEDKKRNDKGKERGSGRKKMPKENIN